MNGSTHTTQLQSSQDHDMLDGSDWECRTANTLRSNRKVFFLCISYSNVHGVFSFVPLPAGGCLLVFRPEWKPPALNIVLACGEVAAMHP